MTQVRIFSFESWADYLETQVVDAWMASGALATRISMIYAETFLTVPDTCLLEFEPMPQGRIVL